jgi:hypothetical protein
MLDWVAYCKGMQIREAGSGAVERHAASNGWKRRGGIDAVLVSRLDRWGQPVTGPPLRKGETVEVRRLAKEEACERHARASPLAQA